MHDLPAASANLDHLRERQRQHYGSADVRHLDPVAERQPPIPSRSTKQAPYANHSVCACRFEVAQSCDKGAVMAQAS